MLLGCRITELPHNFSWDFDVHRDIRDKQRGKVWLIVDGKRYMITDDPIGRYRIISPEDYAQKQVPSNAVLACTSWWAGCGEDMYVEVESNHVMVFRREYSETITDIPAYTLFRAFPIKKRANKSSLPTGISSIVTSSTAAT